MYSALDIAGQEKLLDKEQQIAGRLFQIFFLFFFHVTAYYSSTCTNDWLEMVI